MRRHTRRAIRAALTAGQALAAAACGLLGLLRYAAKTGLTLLISYVKEDGTESNRPITPEKVWLSKAGDWCLRAACLLRGEHRTFRIGRITTLETA
ncbi:WYL domain-containing protein (plasmid) [Streptomyces platensis]|uniref:WYL domain-containing protein n=1 Tax=Streptomyces platensis TaxID=58346 RepID=UPI002ED3015D|nr:WYL domain-containing protein [Streptomyces platensis]